MLYIAEFLVENLGSYGAWITVVSVSLVVIWYFGWRKNSLQEIGMREMKLLVFTAVMLFSLNAAACGMGEQIDGYENASVEHAHAHWSAGDKSPVPFIFIDVRTPEEYAESHIEGATLIPLQQLEKRMAEVPKEKRVYLYCRSGRRSVAAANMLTRAGYNNIENITGGINAWEGAGYPTVQ